MCRRALSIDYKSTAREPQVAGGPHGRREFSNFKRDRIHDRRDIIPIVDVETPMRCVNPEQRTEITGLFNFSRATR